jgi:flagellar protein FlgJ
MQRDPSISPLSELGGLSRLAQAAARRDPEAIDAVARRFEALFAEMMVSSMRTASLGDPLFEGQNTMYRDFYDRELASRMTMGRGLGIADMLRKQLSPPSTAPAPAQESGPGPVPFALPPPVQSTPMALPQPAMDPRIEPSPAPAAPASSAVVGLCPPLPALPQAPAYFPDPQLAAIGDITAPYARSLVPPVAIAGFPEEPVAEQASPQQVALANLSRTKAGTPEGFVAQVWPHARAAAAELGVDPRMLVAQAALETGWGRSVMRGADGQPSHNVFGIKATGGWQGAEVRQSTFEFRGGVMQRERAAFRAYESVGESFADYVRLVRDNPRYREALQAGADGPRFADALARAGYATDPQYAAKLKAIADGPTLRRALAQLPLAATQEA